MPPGSPSTCGRGVNDPRSRADASERRSFTPEAFDNSPSGRIERGSGGSAPRLRGTVTSGLPYPHRGLAHLVLRQMHIAVTHVMNPHVPKPRPLAHDVPGVVQVARRPPLIFLRITCGLSASRRIRDTTSTASGARAMVRGPVFQSYNLSSPASRSIRSQRRFRISQLRLPVRNPVTQRGGVP